MSYSRLAFGIGPVYINEAMTLQANALGVYVNMQGGTAINDSVSEVANAVDTVDAAGGSFLASIEESASALDIVSVSSSTQNVTITETASAGDTVSLGSIVYSGVITENASALDTITIAGGVFSSAIVEIAVAEDETDVTLHRRIKWFLSFVRVTPAPEGQGGGATGELFGDYHYVTIYPED